MEETLETRHILLWKNVPPHSPEDEGSKYCAVSIPTFHHNNLQFSVFIGFNNDSGTLFEI